MFRRIFCNLLEVDDQLFFVVKFGNPFVQSVKLGIFSRLSLRRFGVFVGWLAAG